MSIGTYTKTKNYADGLKWTEAVMDAFADGLKSFLDSEVTAKAPDKTGSETITGNWTFSNAITATGGVATGSNTIERSDGDVWTLPDLGAQNFVGDTGTQTLTNKSLTSPTLTGNVSLPATDPPTANMATRESICKGWAYITIAAGTPTLTNSYNVSGIVDGGAGITTVTWNTDFANANYAVVATAEDPNGTDPFIVSWRNKLTGSVDIYTRLRSTGALTDNINITVIAFGDQ